MVRKPARNRSQTLSLRTSPLTRYTLEKASVVFRQSMTDVIERGVSLLAQKTEYELPQWVLPVEEEETISLFRLVQLTWHDDETIRLLRTGIIAPALLSAEDAFVMICIMKIIPYRIGDEDSWYGEDDPFEGVQMSEAYYKEWPRFNLEKIRHDLDTIKMHSSLSEIDLGLAFRGALGDIRKIQIAGRIVPLSVK
ncbi:TPA: hypothetical protein ACKPYC_002068 [Pseudomonas aeruginosa]|uniref:hypothetical protein n=1 Tax=Pseudomonas TaxID=286 RepID=UPI0008FB589C|nr:MULTISPECIES: hypothetical protein [Pseudomonas]AYW43000.1 hypothetical protein DL351_27655 [Pseudomonas aeruginosa]MBA5620381.1 hypothetical protein [Pseudomonas aeruginosa]MBG5429748.1 hypothetical protein [Pseudomonas aeruginosa]MBG6740039.1 hypothetical protein [Pseudomonas aeruginosa]MBH3792046.1 hypothetical protein [Pseudomonas aeruginosa]